MTRKTLLLPHLLVLAFTLLAGGAGAQPHAAAARGCADGDVPPCGMNGWSRAGGALPLSAAR